MRRLILVAAAVFAGIAWAQSSFAPPKAHSAITRSYTRRGYLGVGVIDVTDARAKALNLKDSSGVEVKRVDDNSPAAKAGLREDDIILEVDGKRIETVEQFIHAVSDSAPGTKLALTVWRNGAKQVVFATIEARPSQLFVFNGPDGMPQMPDMPPMPEIGMDANGMPFIMGSSQRVGFEGEMLTPQLAEYFGVKDGILVRTVLPKTPAERAGLKAGDVVTKVNGTPVSTPREISSLVHMSRNGKVAFTIVRNHHEQVLNVEMPQQKGSLAISDRLQL
jgi:serine protease Do